MAEVDAVEELQSCFIAFHDILQQLDSCADNLATEYLERKLEDYVTICLGHWSFRGGGVRKSRDLDVSVGNLGQNRNNELKETHYTRVDNRT